jgi:cytochrome c
MRGWLAVLLLWALPAQADEFITLKGHGGPIMGLQMTAQGDLVSASFDNSVGLWPQGRTPPQWFEGHEAAVVALTMAGDRIISGGDDFTLREWPSGQVIGRHQGMIADLAHSPATGQIASASWDGSIGLWGAAPQKLMGHKGAVTAVVFADQGRALYSSSSDGTIRLWDLTKGQSRVVVHHGFGVNRLVLDERSGWLAYGAVDGGTRVIDLRTHLELRDFTLDRRPVLAIAYHAPSQQLAVGDGQGYIMMLDTANWRIARDFRATRSGPIWALRFSPDGARIWAGGLDDVIYGWPVDLLDRFDPVATPTRSFQKNASQMSNGERQFARKCSICHSLTPGSARKAGPSLHGIFGRAAGSLGDYLYSQTLQNSDIVWDEHSISALFEQGPDHYIPGSKMPMQVIAAPQDRADLITFLMTATQE